MPQRPCTRAFGRDARLRFRVDPMTDSTNNGIQKKPRLRPDVLAMAVIVAVAGSMCVPYVRSGGRINLNPDLLKDLLHHGAARSCILEHGQFPFRSHFIGGGFPVAGEPDSPIFSPWLILTLCFGEVLGLKVFACLMYFVAGLSMYWMARETLKLDWVAALFAGLLFVLSDWLPTRVLSCNLQELCYVFTPLVLLLWVRAVERGRPLLLLAVALAALLMDGRQAWLCIMVFLACFTCLRCMRLQGARVQLDLKWLTRLVVLVLMVAALGMVKIVPTLHTFWLRGALMPQTHSPEYSPGSIVAMDRDFARGFVNRDLGARLPRVYMGYVPALLLAMACILCGKRLWRYLVLLALFAWLGMAYHAPVDVFRLLWMLPFFSAIENPLKYLDFFIVLLSCIMVGAAIDYGRRLVPRKTANAVCALLACAAFAPLALRGLELNGRAFGMAMPAYTRVHEFCHTQGIKMRSRAPGPDRKVQRNQYGLCNGYFYMLRNMGHLDWGPPVGLPVHARPKYFVTPENDLRFNSEYLGGAYFADGTGRAELAQLSPCRITVKAHAEGPGTLVVNQNFDARWRADLGAVRSHRGLLAVDVAGPGEHEVTFRYVPYVCYAGMAISAASLVAMGLALCISRRRASARGRAPVESAPGIRQRLRRAAQGTVSFGWRDLRRPAVVAGLVGALSLLIVLWAVLLKPALLASDLMWQGDCSLRARDIDAALRHYRDARRLRPDRERPHLAVGLCHLARREPVAAAAVFEEVAARWPDDSEAWFLLGTAHWRSRRVDRAVEAMRRAAELSPYEHKIFRALGVYLAVRGDVGEALRTLSRAVELGYEGIEELEARPELKALTSRPEYAALVAKVRGFRQARESLRHVPMRESE